MTVWFTDKHQIKAIVTFIIKHEYVYVTLVKLFLIVSFFSMFCVLLNHIPCITSFISQRNGKNNLKFFVQEFLLRSLNNPKVSFNLSYIFYGTPGLKSNIL